MPISKHLILLSALVSYCRQTGSYCYEFNELWSLASIWPPWVTNLQNHELSEYGSDILSLSLHPLSFGGYKHRCWPSVCWFQSSAATYDWLIPTELCVVVESGDHWRAADYHSVFCQSPPQL